MEERVNAALATFGSLGSEHIRMKFIEKLASRLSHNEVRYLKEWTADQTYHYDIVANLPLELVPFIFRYLPLESIFVNRRVSKHWARALSLTDTTNALLRPWIKQGDPELQLPADTSPEAAASYLAEHIKAIQDGDAFSVSKVNWDVALQDNAPVAGATFAYGFGYMTWVDRKTREMVVLHIATATTARWSLPNRQLPVRVAPASVCMAVSDAFMAVGDIHGQVILRNHSSGQQRSIQTSSGNILYMVLAGVTLAVLHASAPGQVVVTTWSASTDRCLTFAVESGVNAVNWHVLIDKSERFVAVSWMRSSASVVRSEWILQRFTMDGVLQSEGKLEIPLNLRFSGQQSWRTSSDLHAIKVLSSGYAGHIFFVMYDMCRDRMALYTWKIEGESQPGLWKLLISVWKNVVYALDLNTAPQARSYVLKPVTQPATFRLQKAAFQLIEESSWQEVYSGPMNESEQNSGWQLVRDEKFMIRACRSFFLIACFDKSITLPNDSAFYRTARQNKINARRQERDKG